ncbi:MAG: DNA repair exonuclease [Clostridiales bacterium]|nr:DNA repair exonuclease [Clostridiales bacterium]
MTFKFIHMADVHIDTAFKSKDKRLRRILRDAVYESFKRAADEAIARKADAVLIAGDLFDSDTLSFTAEKMMINEMERLCRAEIDVYYAPGNHDPCGGDFALRDIKWPSNVHIFNSHKSTSYEIRDDKGEIKAVVVGAGHESKKEVRDIVKNFPYAKGDVPYVGLVHTYVAGEKNYSGHEKYAPCSLEDLKSRGYTYWAIGHIHAREKLCEEPLIVYPGNIAGRNIKETGLKGVYYVEIRSRHDVKCEFLPVAPLLWEELDINNLDLYNSLSDIENKIYISIRQYMDSLDYSGKLLLRVNLAGQCKLYGELQDEDNVSEMEESLKESLGMEYIDISTGKLTKYVDIKSYYNEPHVLGETLRLIEGLKNDDSLLLHISPDLSLPAPDASKDKKIEYLRELLCNMEYDAASRLIKEDGK